MDTLTLKGIEVLCIIGELPEERNREQRLMVNVDLACDCSAAGASDSIRDTIDYAEMSHTIRRALREAKCRLIERAAEEVAAVCLREPRVASVRVSVEKSGAVVGLASAVVTIERSRK